MQETTTLLPMTEYDNIFENEFGSHYHTDNLHLTKCMHYHDYYEIVFYFGKTPLKYYYEGKYYTVRTGDIVLCDIFKNHQYLPESDDIFTRISFGISPMLMTKLSHEKANLFRIFEEKNENYPVFHQDLVQGAIYSNLIRQYIEIISKPDAYVLSRAYVHLLLAQLYMDCCKNKEEDPENYAKIKMVAEVLSYIEAHMDQWILLKDIADSMNYSTGYFSRIFKEVTGNNLNKYMLMKKIEVAKEMIAKGVSITDAAEKTGFNNYSYFYRAFMKTEGISPREFQESLEK